MKQFLAFLGLLLLSVACSTTGVVATGDVGQGNTANFEQSEVALNVSNFAAKKVITATFNDGTDNDATVLYTNTTRTILKGASLLGWSYSTDGGSSWKYGGKVLPPAGTAVLWGDPAITRSHLDQSLVFISNLAMPENTFPPGGVSGSVSGTVMGGACIAKSKDGGITFQNYQCFSNNGHFYDGGHMAAGTDGAIYAAYWDTETGKIDIWKAPNSNAQFALMPTPFGAGFSMVTHARVRIDLASGDLYVAAQRNNGFVLVNRFHNGAWGSPVNASSLAAPIFPKLDLSDRKLRTGPQFSFDVGAVSVLGNDGVRFVYTVKDANSGRFYVRGSFCPKDLSACFDAPEWGTTPGNFSLTGDQFNPIVRAFPGFIGLPPLWKASYQTRQNDPAGNQVAIYQGNLAVIGQGVRILLPFPLIDNQVVCGDVRGYWGDYDDMQLQGFSSSGSAWFIRSFTDSRKGCLKMWQFTSHHHHVSSAVIK